MERCSGPGLSLLLGPGGIILSLVLLAGALGTRLSEHRVKDRNAPSLGAPGWLSQRMKELLIWGWGAPMSLSPMWGGEIT